jgi:Cu+-exporting ATPase
MDVLIALGTTAAYGFSIWNYMTQTFGQMYFETSASIITLILCGRWLESKSKRKTSDAVEKLLSLQPKTALIERNNKLVSLSIHDIDIDDIVIIRPGDSIPVDGEVVEGHSYVNESMLTGESFPLEKQVSSLVFAATLNGSGLLKVKTTKIGSETLLSKIAQFVETAQNSRAPIQNLADMISSIFVPIVLVISACTFLAWWLFIGNFNQGLISGIAVLVIACPCALGLATPTVITIASGVGARLGIFFKEALALEKAGKIDALVLDKTGTLTEGKPKVIDVYPVGKFQSQDVIQIAASLENYAKHPISEAVLNYALLHKISVEPMEKFESFPGKGITGEKYGLRYYIGSLKMFREHEMDLPLSLETLDVFGNTVCFVWNDHEMIGYFTISDELKKNSAAAIARLNKMHVHTIMLTGDHSNSAARIASQAKIKEYFAEVTPEKKASTIYNLKTKYRTVGMVGDGINDAPALAAAAVSFAISSGSDIAIETADIALMGNDLISVVEAIQLSKVAFRTIRQNLFFAFIYNILGIPLAAFGLLNPIIAAAAMALSSISVIANSLLLKKWKPPIAG